MTTLFAIAELKMDKAIRCPNTECRSKDIDNLGDEITAICMRCNIMFEPYDDRDLRIAELERERDDMAEEIGALSKALAGMNEGLVAIEARHRKLREAAEKATVCLSSVVVDDCPCRACVLRRVLVEDKEADHGAMTAYAHELFVSWPEFGKLLDRVRDVEENERRLKDKLEQAENRIFELERYHHAYREEKGGS